jgi:hypothetical protein
VNKGGSSGSGSGGQVSNGGSGSGSGGQTTGTGGSTGSGGDTGSAIEASFKTVKLVLEGGSPFHPCATADCHGANGNAPPGNHLTLRDDADLYKNLTTHISADCGNIPVVNPGKPDQSALVKILKGPCSAKTVRMPLGCLEEQGNCIPPEYIAAIAKWIENGANPNQ